MSDRSDLQIKILNNCFDDIERFVVRLQTSAEAYRDSARASRGGSRGANVPAPNEFMDVFAKFKLAFNLLGELQGYIRDPNAQELVHFLFTPLSLMVAASRDPKSQAPDVASKVASPMLTRNARNLLQDCVTPREEDLWRSLGDAWTMTSDEWTQPTQPYYPQFTSGFAPSPQQMDSLFSASPRMDSRGLDYQPQASRPVMRATVPMASEAPAMYTAPPPVALATQPEATRTVEAVDVAPSREYIREYGPPGSFKRGELPFEEEQQRYAERIIRRGAKCYEVRFDRVGTNSKELTVKRGEAVEVLDDGKNWWRVRNAYDGEGFVPYTIVKPWEASGPPIIIDNTSAGRFPVPQPYYSMAPPDYGYDAGYPMYDGYSGYDYDDYPDYGNYYPDYYGDMRGYAKRQPARSFYGRGYYF